MVPSSVWLIRHWPKCVSCTASDSKLTSSLENLGRCDSSTFSYNQVQQTFCLVMVGQLNPGVWVLGFNHHAKKGAHQEYMMTSLSLRQCSLGTYIPNMMIHKFPKHVVHLRVCHVPECIIHPLLILPLAGPNRNLQGALRGSDFLMRNTRVRSRNCTICKGSVPQYPDLP